MNVLSIGNIFYMCTSIIVCSLSWYFIMKGYITIFTFFFSLCLFLNLFVFIPVSYFLAYSLRACCSRYSIFRLFTWGRWRSANYWLILLHAGFPFFYFFFHDSTCALFLLGFSPIHSLFFLFLFDISFFYFFISFALFVSTFYYTLCLFPTFTFFFHLHNLPSKGNPAFPLPLMFLTPFFEYRWLCPPFYRFTLKSRNLSIFSTSYFNSFPCL